MTEAYESSGLREQMVAIICEEWPNPDNQIAAATIFERLQSEGVGASVLDVHNALFQLVQQGVIGLNLPASHHPFTDIFVVRVSRQELCE
jgi:Fe2+ or Zn2+ uptake regulation protein